MDKQVDKQTNNKRFVLKKGQIDILEALYGCRFGGCWLFWVGLLNRTSLILTKRKKTVSLFVCRSVAVEG